MKNPWILPAAALAIGALGGFISGKNTKSAQAEENTETELRNRRTTQRDERPQNEASLRRTRRVSGTDEIGHLTGNSTRIQAMIEFYAGLTAEQLEQEAGKLEDMPMNERMMASFLLFGRWAEVDPTSAMSFSNTMGFSGMFVRPTILQSWASVDPENAAKYFAENPREFAMMGGGRGPMNGQGGSAIIASEWARQDPEAALAWSKSLTTEKSRAISAVIDEVAKTDPKKAAALLTSMQGEDLGDAYRSLATRFGASDFNEAETWIRTLPADQQADALASAIGGLSNKDPQAAARQLAAMHDGAAKNEALPNVVRDWARLDPAAASGLLQNQTNEEVLRDSLRQLIPAWVGQNPSAALDFANSYEPGPVRDSALQSYVWSNQSAPPAEVIRVAETISDEEDRNRAISIAAARWMRESPDQARSYVQQSSNLSDNAKQRILDGRDPWDRGRRGQN